MSAQRFGTVHAKFWRDDKVKAWNEREKLVALYLLTSPHSTIAGAMCLPELYLAADLDLTAEQVLAAFARLERDGFMTYCPRSKWLIVNKRLAYDEPRNPASMKGVLNILAEVPRDHRGLRVIAPLVRELCERHKLEAPPLLYTNGPDPGASGNGGETIPRPSPDSPETVSEPTAAPATAAVTVDKKETLAPVVVPKPVRPRATPPPREAPVGADDGSESALVQRFCHDPRVTERLKPGDPVEGYRRAIGMVGLWRTERAGKGDLAEILRDALAPDIGNPIGQAITEMKRIDQGSRAFERLRRESTADLRFYQDDPIEGSAEVLS